MKLVEHLYEQVRAGTLARPAALEMLRELHASTQMDPCRLHDLVHQNTSTLHGQRYTSSFTGDEILLRDHQVGGRIIIPAAVHLEMACVALRLAAGQHHDAPGELVLRSIAWARPAVIEAAPFLIHVGIEAAGAAGEIHFDIHGERLDAAGADEQTFVRGEASYRERGEPRNCPLSELGALSEPAGDAAAHYAAFAALGIEYGSGLRSVQQLRIGSQDGERFVLAELLVPGCAAVAAGQYVLHPSIVDGAFQACIGLWQANHGGAADGSGGAVGTFVPFALEELQILGTSPARAFAYLRETPGNTPAHLRKVDIELMDEGGRVWASVKGLTCRALQAEQPARPQAIALEASGMLASEQEDDAVAEPLDLRDRAVRYLKRLLSGTLKLPASRIEADAPLEKYGIDSISALRMVQELERVFGSLSKTLLFEYRSIEELAGYFHAEHRQRLSEQLGEVGGRGAAEPAPRTHVRALPVARRARRGRAAQPASPAQGARDIAVIGVSGRYPQAQDLEQFWENLKAGKDCITEIPKQRWDHDLYFDAQKGKSGKTYSKWGGFIEGIDQFDPLFFNISPREAEIMDPQERLFLQCVYETIEDAGYTRESLRTARQAGEPRSSVGVFVGVMYEEYQLYGAQAQVSGAGYALGGSASSIANRVSYFCNFHGPSLAVDTMCSSSLTAIHLACQSLMNAECEVAVAGGVNVSIHPNKYLGLAQGQFASSTGRCESFGEGGDGYVPGEGVGAVLLKPLAQAIEDGDQIHAVIKASSLNHGGKTNGYTVPNPQAQAQVISAALQGAKLSARQLSYIEAHGTGTSLGDPIEIAGLSKAFREHTAEVQFCAIGSIKSNIGHCESAAGIAGVTKVLLQFKHAQLVPSLHSQVLNPHIDFESSPFIVQRELAHWPRPVLSLDGTAKPYPRLAGVSSFGAGGANAHVILEEYEAPPGRAAPHYPSSLPIMVVLSGKDEGRLQQQARRLLAVIDTRALGDEHLHDLAYTLQVGREAMEHRLAMAVSGMDALRQRLREFIAGEPLGADCYRGELRRHDEAVAVFAADEDLHGAIQAWIVKGKYSKLLELWVKGLSFDWNRLYGASRPRRISLPSYPFDTQRYWVAPTAATAGALRLHPLVHQNTSDFDGQKFTSVFSGDEYPLRDHRVAGRRIMPAAAHLEMARIALRLSAHRAPTTSCCVTSPGCGRRSPSVAARRSRQSEP